LLEAENVLSQVDLKEVNNDRPIFFFNQLLEAYANEKQVSQLLSLLRKLVDDPELPSPEEFSFNVCLSVLPPGQSFAILKGMVDQDIFSKTTFNTVISAYCKAKKIEKAVEVLTLMTERVAGMKPDKFSFTPIISALGKARRAPEANLMLDRMISRGVTPDVVTWTTVLHAWAVSNEAGAGQRALQLFNRMQQDAKVQPDTAAYNAAILAWAKESNKGAEAEQLLRMMSTEPNIVTYTTCILAWKNSPNLPEAVERAGALYEDLRMSDITPNAMMFSTLISLYARRGLADYAEDVLQHVEKPNIIIYATVLEAWANSNREDAIEKAFDLIERMEKVKPNIITLNILVKVVTNNHGPKVENLQKIKRIWELTNIEPDIRTYNAMFNACGASKGEEMALNFLLDSFDEMQRAQISVDRYTYPALFRALAALKAPLEIVKQILQRCVEHNAVEGRIIDILQRSCSTTKQFQELTAHHELYKLKHTHRWTKKSDGQRRR